MRLPPSHLSFRIVVLACTGLLAPLAFAWNSAKVMPDPVTGRLTYPADSAGNRIPDFSHAGYRGGGVPLPTVPVVKTLSPTTGDNTARIQAALDEVGALPLQADGYRGALRLSTGVYQIDGTLRLTKSGVVLSGVGNGDDPATNTILRRSGTSQTAIIQAGNLDDQFKSEVVGTRSQITTALVPVGARGFEVDHPEYYRVGDPVVIFHASTQAWLDAVDRGGVTDSNYWRPGEIDIRYHRYVTAVQGNTVTVDAPMFTNLDRTLSQSVVYKYDRSATLTRLGIEQLQVDIVTRGELTEDHAEDAITFVGVEDSWIRDTTAKHFWHAGVQWEGSTRCTAERCRAIEPHGPIDGGYRYNFSMYHSQLILVRDSFTSYARHAFVCNGTSLDSGIVFLNGVIDHGYTSTEGHRRWSTGLLYDNIVATARQSTDFMGLYNRGTYGTGHGWAAAHSVAWNCDAAGGRTWIQRPPTAQNYGIGCTGNVTGSGPFAGPVGYIEGTNQSGLEPRSLYLAQLAERLAAAVEPPAITAQPVAQTVALGGTVALNVTATGTALAYQWKLNGAAISGATDSTYLLTRATTAHAGTYTVTITNPAGTVTSAAAALTVSATADLGRIVNLSIRTAAGTGAQTLIVGAALGGLGTSGTKPVLLRAVGPALTAYGVTGALADPQLTLFSGSTTLATNDNWAGDAQLVAISAQVGAFAFPSATSKDAALFRPALASGSYTMQLAGVGSTTGTALAELYDATPAASFTTTTPRLTNVSARTQVGTGSDILIAGFVIGGTGNCTVLLRAVGPALASYGVTGTLADPQLALYNSSALIRANDDWAGSPTLASTFTTVGAFALDPASKDAALLVTLPPGSYTVQVSGTAATTGVALVEIYEVP